MGDPLVPSDAVDEEGEEGYQSNHDGFDSLEERIFNTERDHEREVSSGVRLEYWMDSLVNTINGEIGTNKVEVMVRAYTEGLKVLREEFKEDSEDIYWISEELDDLIQEFCGDHRYANEIEMTRLEREVERPNYPNRKYMEPTGVSMKDSERSEVNKFFKDWLGFGGWIHRRVLALGLGNSDYIKPRQEKHCEEDMEKLRKRANDCRNSLENVCRKFAHVNMTHWLDNGISEDHFEKLKNIRDHMNTESKGELTTVIELLEENDAVIEGKPIVKE